MIQLANASTDRAKERINFTKAALERLQPAVARRVVHDETQPGLVLHVEPSGSKAFYVFKKINGRPRRIRIGTFPTHTVEQARRAARQMIADIERGNDPVESRRQKRDEMTLGELWAIYLERHAQPHKKASSRAGDERSWNAHLKALKARPLSGIKRGDVQHLHTKIGKSAPYSANRVIALLRKMFAVGIDLGHCPENPCTGIKKFQEQSRERFLDGDEIKRFVATVNDRPKPRKPDEERDPDEIDGDMLDLFAMLLWTGARRGNVLAMRWDQLDMKAKVWRIPADQTKNAAPYTIHLSEPAIDIIKRRSDENKTKAKLGGKASQWVFPGRGGVGHLQEPKKSWAAFCAKAKLTKLRMHDLRRTMGSWQVMTGASLAVIGKSLGHKSQSATAIYARMNLDPVRLAVDAATVAMLAAANAKDEPAVLAKIG